jgi:hypothetical protein
MPIRDIALFLIVIWMIPYCLRQPWLAILAFSWIGYMNPHRLTWGFAHDFSFALVFAICAFLGMLFVKDPESRPIPWTRETWLLAILWGLYGFTTIFALFPDAAIEQLQKVSKILLFTFLMLRFFQTQQRLRALFMVLALSIGFFGLKGGIWSVLINGGADRVQGPEGTFIGGNTELGLALNMVLPFLLLLARDEQRKWLRRLLFTMFVTSIISIIFTYSRGALIGLPVVLAMLFLGRAAASAALFFSPCLCILSTRSRRKRGSTGRSRSPIMRRTRPRRDASCPGGWRGGWQATARSPGAVFGSCRIVRSSRATRPAILLSTAPTVSTSPFWRPRIPRIVRLRLADFLVRVYAYRFGVASAPDSRRGAIAKLLSDGPASLVVYAVSGAFLTQAYWDLFYHLVAFVILLKAIAHREGFLDRGRLEGPSAKSAAPSVKSVPPTLPALPVAPQVRRTRAQRIVR